MRIFDRLRSARHPSSRNDEAAVDEQPAQLLSGTGRDLGAFKDNDIPLKVWVPDPVKEALEELARHYDSNMSTLIRHVLFVHVYGVYDLLAMAERGDRRFLPQGFRESFNDEIRYSRTAAAANRTADLGKNDRDIKIWAPAPLIEEIDQLAEQAGIKRSEFIRETLVSHLFGRKQLPDRS